MSLTDDAVHKDDQPGATTNLGTPSDQDLSVSGPSDQDLSIAAPSDQDLSIATPTDLSHTNLSTVSDQELANGVGRTDINGSDLPIKSGASSLVEEPAEY